MSKTKGIILAGGFGKRLYPLTLGVSKHLLPVYDKPMIYYPLSNLMMAGIRDILIISTQEHPRFKIYLETEKKIGLNIDYKAQNNPNGIAECFILGKDFIGDDNVCLILGDNIFHGVEFEKFLKIASNNLKHKYSSIFGVKVNNPNDFGVIQFG